MIACCSQPSPGPPSSPGHQSHLSSPRSSGSWPGSARPRAQEAHSPGARGSGSPWFLSPPALYWTCSSIRSLTYSNIHSVTRGHRGKETIGILSCQRVEVLKRNKKNEKQNRKRTPEQNCHLPCKIHCSPPMPLTQPLTQICKKAKSGKNQPQEQRKQLCWRLARKKDRKAPCLVLLIKDGLDYFFEEA